MTERFYLRLDNGDIREISGSDAIAKAIENASLEDVFGVILEKSKKRDEDFALVTKRYNTLAKSNARLTEENQRLKAADAERKRLLVRAAAFEEENSRLRGQLSQETKKRKEAEEAARDATDRLRRCEDEKREIETENVFLNAMRHAPAPTSAPGKDEIIRELADRIMEWAEGHTDADGRSKMKSMITDVFRNNLTEEQWERHADLDLRDTKKATQVNVWGGGVYNNNVERQALDAPVKRTRRNGEQGWLINR